VVEGARGGFRPLAHGDDDLLVWHRRDIAGGKNARQGGFAARIDFNLAARRQGERALESASVGQQADLHEDAFELDLR
jgi:hypothetical protein